MAYSESKYIDGLDTAGSLDGSELIPIFQDGEAKHCLASDLGAVNSWTPIGNAGTIPGTNFVGTTDANVGLMFKVEGIQCGFIERTNSGGGNNTSFGFSALINAVPNSGADNVALGRLALATLTTGVDNVAVGEFAGGGIGGLGISTGSRNTCIGDESGENVNGNNNTFLGAFSGFGDSHFSAAPINNTINIGTYAGRYNQTDSDKIFINSLDRADYTGDQTESPIYIEQNVVVANQKVFINSLLNISVVPVFADNAAALSGGLVAGAIYRTGDNLKVVH